MSAPRVRFAPSPSGDLHIGNVRTALYGWLWARKTGGSFILRIEDTDRQRSSDASCEVIYRDMQWLGLDWDEGPNPDGGDRGTRGPYRSSLRQHIYDDWAERLVTQGRAYRCYCTKAELDALRAKATKYGEATDFKYPGTCRERTDEPDLPYMIRLKTDRLGSISYTDLVFGPKDTPNADLQDVALTRSDGTALYNLGVVVDDILMDTTVVSRGRDHMANTPLQILLYRAFDGRVPDFAHLPMLLGPDGEKLAKRHGASSVREYREMGCAPWGLLNYLARLGWSLDGTSEIFARDALVAAFDWSGCGTSDCMIDPQKLLAINHAHLKSLLDLDDYAARVVPFLAARGLAATPADVRPALFAIRERARTFAQAADLLDPFFRDPPELDEAAARKLLVRDAAPRLRGLRDALAGLREWSGFEDATQRWLASASLTLKDVGQPARIALVGRTTSPGLFDVLTILGRDRSLARLDRAAQWADNNG